MGRPRKISVEMLLAARERNWTTSQAAEQYGFNKQSIHEACIRLGVRLDGMRLKFEEPKKFSCSPKAIENFETKQKLAMKEAP